MKATPEEFIEGLRQIADFLTEHPEVPKPYHLMGGEFFIYLHGKEQRATLATIAKAMGRAEKKVDGDHYLVSRRFAGITLIAQADREEVCERVVVGTREVEVEEPDPAALAAVPKVKRTKVVEDVEWRCTPLLAEPAPDAEPQPSGWRDEATGLASGPAPVFEANDREARACRDGGA